MELLDLPTISLGAATARVTGAAASDPMGSGAARFVVAAAAGPAAKAAAAAVDGL